jgi:general L-amino acid transport system permease protein
VPTEKWGGLPVTLLLSVFGLALAFPLAIFLALGRRSHMPIIRSLAIGYIEIVRGVPLITILFMASILFPLFLPAGASPDKLLRAQVAIILFAAAYIAEVVRAGLQGVGRGQYEAADALGLRYWQAMRLVILPQALKIVIPPLVNTFIGFFKDTTLIIIVGLFDFLTTIRAALTDPNWQGFANEAYVFAAAVYFVFCFTMSKYSQYLEKVLNPERRR